MSVGSEVSTDSDLPDHVDNPRRSVEEPASDIVYSTTRGGIVE
jgi:hypothetical protein